MNPRLHPRHPAAPWSGFLKGTSIAIALLLLGASALVAATVPAGSLLRVAGAALPLAILLAAAPFMVRGYELHDGILLVRRTCWTTRVALGDLREVATDPEAGTGSIRLFGNGGLFVFSGWFRSAKLGRYRAFVTDWQHAVVLRSAKVTVVLSPADPAGFVHMLQADAAPSDGKKPLPRWRRMR